MFPTSLASLERTAPFPKWPSRSAATTSGESGSHSIMNLLCRLGDLPSKERPLLLPSTDSLYTTIGGLTFTLMFCSSSRRKTVISKCSSPIPARRASPVSWLVVT